MGLKDVLKRLMEKRNSNSPQYERRLPEEKELESYQKEDYAKALRKEVVKKRLERNMFNGNNTLADDSDLRKGAIARTLDKTINKSQYSQAQLNTLYNKNNSNQLNDKELKQFKTFVKNKEKLQKVQEKQFNLAQEKAKVLSNLKKKKLKNISTRVKRVNRFENNVGNLIIRGSSLTKQAQVIARGREQVAQYQQNRQPSLLTEQQGLFFTNSQNNNPQNKKLSWW